MAADAGLVSMVDTLSHTERQLSLLESMCR